MDYKILDHIVSEFLNLFDNENFEAEYLNYNKRLLKIDIKSPDKYNDNLLKSEELERKQEIISHLNGTKLSLREDSVLYYNYIFYKSGDINQIISRMKEVHFLFSVDGLNVKNQMEKAREIVKKQYNGKFIKDKYKTKVLDQAEILALDGKTYDYYREQIDKLCKA